MTGSHLSPFCSYRPVLTLSLLTRVLRFNVLVNRPKHNINGFLKFPAVASYGLDHQIGQFFTGCNNTPYLVQSTGRPENVSGLLNIVDFYRDADAVL